MCCGPFLVPRGGACNNACMVAIQIRDVPEAVSDALKVRAQRDGLSVQRYLLELITAEAAMEHNREVLSREPLWTRTVTAGTHDIADLITAGREERTDRIMDTVEP